MEIIQKPKKNGKDEQMSESWRLLSKTMRKNTKKTQHRRNN